ncbi:MAG TPA: permease-like cell division protein FtsX [Candidatus Polarisedimenticolia bacterium]|nr:permease-like cell division protein FtsX [Candidatus Polarisedimenticolia bacterium]
MRRLLRALLHCVREAWEGLWRNAALSLLAATSIGVSLYILGLFLVLAFNLNLFVESLGRDIQVQIYLADGAAPEAIAALRNELLSDPAVASARFVSRDEARQRFRQNFPTLRDLSERLGGNPFPAAFELALRPGYRDAGGLERLAASYRKAPGVEEVRYDLGWIERLNGLAGLVRRGGYGLGALLGFGVLVTVGAVVRLTVLARREEIEIMKLVGATAAFIRGPFLLGAAAQGLLGGGLAVGGLILTHRLVERSAVFRANPFMALVAGRFLPTEAALLLAAGGALLGLAAALLSLRRAGTF